MIIIVIPRNKEVSTHAEFMQVQDRLLFEAILYQAEN